MRELFRRKTLHAASGATSSLKRTLSAVDLVFLGVGAIFGTGVFVITGRAASFNAGPAVAISFLFAGLAASLAAFCYAELASMMPVAGSAYAYTYATGGELLAFLIGWDLILEYLVSAALVSVGWSGYLCAAVESVTGKVLDARWTRPPIAYDSVAHELVITGSYVNLPAVFLCVAVSLILYCGIKGSARFSAFAVTIKITVVCLFLYYTSQHMRIENLRPFLPDNLGEFGRFGMSGLFQGTTMVYLSYIGFDAVSTAAQESKRPQRDIPVGILLPLVICTIFYVAVALVLTGAVHYTELSVAHPLARGVAVTKLKWLEIAVGLGAVLGLSSNILGMIMAQSRIFLSMAADGLFPKQLAAIHPKHATPHVATMLTGVGCALLGGLVPIEILGELTSIGTLFAFLLVSVGVTLLRIREPNVPRRFKVAGGPYLIPLTSAALSVVLMAAASGHTLWRLFAWMGLGLVVYFAYSKKRSNLATRSVASKG